MDRRFKLKELIDSRFDGSQAAFSRAIQRAPAQVHHWVSGHRMLGDAGARHIEMTLNLPMGWLDGKTAANTQPPDIFSISSQESHKIPLLSFIQASQWRSSKATYEVTEPIEWLYTDQKLSNQAFALEISENSMLPEFKEGDRVIIDPEIKPQPGDFVAASNHEGATFKKYRLRGINPSGDSVYELVALNDDYPTMHSAQEDIKILGTMIEHRRYRARK